MIASLFTVAVSMPRMLAEEQSFSELWETIKSILSFGLAEQLDTPLDIPSYLAIFAVKTLFPISGLILFLYFVYGGYLWLSSAGDPGKVEKARDTLVNALIGFVIMTLAWTITLFVMKLFDVGSVKNEEPTCLVTERVCCTDTARTDCFCYPISSNCPR